MEIQIEFAGKAFDRTALLATALVIAVAMGGCAGVKEKAGETRAPIPARALSVHSACTARDAAGYTESIRLTVDRGRVGLLEAKIDIPRRGSCSFHLADFRQTRTEPHVELKSSTGTMCTVRMWQQDGRFTVAFSDCQEKCTRGAFDYVWPMHLKMADGSCL